MNRHSCYLDALRPHLELATVAILLVASLAAQAQVRDTKVVVHTARLTGIVRDAETGTVMRRAMVRATSLSRRETRTALTGSDGRFEIPDVEVGRYSISGSKGGYVTSQYGQKRPFAQGTPVDVKAGDTIDIVLPLTPGASIEGVVLDEFGEPVADAVMMTLRTQYAGGRRRLAPTGRVLTTNDRGEFRLFGLPAGSYVLSASPIANQNEASPGTIGFAPSYFPGTTDPGSAETIGLAAGERRVGANLILAMVKTASVVGVASDANGAPMTGGAVVAVSWVGGLPLVAGSTQIKQDGAFALDGLPPGRFTLAATSNAKPAPGTPVDVGVAEVNTANGSVTGVLVTVPRLSRISGAIRMFDDRPPTPIQVRLRSLDPSELLDSNAAILQVKPDGTFDGSVRAGRFMVDIPESANSLYLQRVMQNGSDVSDGIVVIEGEPLEGLQLVVTDQPAVVSGELADPKASRDYAAVVFAKDPDRRGYRSRFIAAVKSNAAGQFEIKGLPQGDYLAVAVDYLEAGEERDGALLEAWSYQAQPVTVTTGKPASVKLTLERR